MSSGISSTRNDLIGFVRSKQPMLSSIPYEKPSAWVHLSSVNPVTFQAAAVEAMMIIVARETFILTFSIMRSCRTDICIMPALGRMCCRFHLSYSFSNDVGRIQGPLSS